MITCPWCKDYQGAEPVDCPACHGVRKVRAYIDYARIGVFGGDSAPRELFDRLDQLLAKFDHLVICGLGSPLAIRWSQEKGMPADPDLDRLDGALLMPSEADDSEFRIACDRLNVKIWEPLR